MLSHNECAIDILEQNQDKIDWWWICLNPAAVHLLEERQEEIEWYFLCQNKNAINLIKQNLDKIDWEVLSRNPSAVELLEDNLDRIDWDNLSMNERAIQIIERNSLRFYSAAPFNFLSENPGIFEYDYENMAKNCNIYKEELMQKTMHPDRISRYLKQGYCLATDEYELHITG